MRQHHQQQRVIASARQIMDIPAAEQETADPATASITWFAFGHAVILLTLAVHLLTRI